MWTCAATNLLSLLSCVKNKNDNRAGQDEADWRLFYCPHLHLQNYLYFCLYSCINKNGVGDENSLLDGFFSYRPIPRLF